MPFLFKGFLLNEETTKYKVDLYQSHFLGLFYAWYGCVIKQKSKGNVASYALSRLNEYVPVQTEQIILFRQSINQTN